MPQSDAVVGRPDDETALEYDMPSRSRPTEADVQVSRGRPGRSFEDREAEWQKGS